MAISKWVTTPTFRQGPHATLATSQAPGSASPDHGTINGQEHRATRSRGDLNPDIVVAGRLNFDAKRRGPE